MVRRLFLLVLAVGWLAVASAAVAQAASPAVTRIFVKPNSGYTNSAVQVKGTYATLGFCRPPPLLFTFTIDGRFFWSSSVSYCAPQSYIWDTGLSPYVRLPVSTVGVHTVMLSVSYGGHPVSGGTATWTYWMYQAPASPQPRVTPSPPPSASPSPSPVGCTPLFAGAVPLLGLTLIGAGPFLARRRRLPALLGLALVVATMSCSATTGHTATNAPSPSQHPIVCAQT
jgi:hypothetical protein